MAETISKPKWSGWLFPARTTTLFLIVASLSMGVLAFVGLNKFQQLNGVNSEIRIDRAGRAASQLLGEALPEAFISGDSNGSPAHIELASERTLLPGDRWDDLVDQISAVNQGAANVFRYDATTGKFDRISTSFRTPAGERAGGSQIEPGLIVPGHPAYDNLLANERFVGEVPVAGRLRFAYLTPITDPSNALIGILAVDVGWVDDLNNINGQLRSQAIWVTSLILLMLASAGVLVMFGAFRPLSRLISLAHEVGAGTVPDEIPLRDRRDEIGYLANSLAKVVELQGDLAKRAFHDQLTGLPNRSHLMSLLGERIAQVRSDADEEFALLLIDLDQFKEVNDGLGHAAGDELLVALARTLNEVLEPGEFLARLGGDEFALITTKANSEADVDLVASRVSEAIRSVTRTSVADIGVTSSIGIVFVPRQADTVSTALAHADLALYRAKRSGRAHWQYYETSLSSPIQRRLHLATELRRAIDEREITLEYQPLFAASTQQLGGLEALARWHHPVEGAIPPGEFVSAAENAGLINDLGSYVLDLACSQVRSWRDQGFIVPPMSVNVSTVQLWQADFHEYVNSILDVHRLEPGSLCLELTESVVVHHADGRSRQVLQRLAESGVRLSIDDFGTGYSSLSYLQDLHVHQLKIDRMFVAGNSIDSGHDQLFAGIASLGHSLGLEVVAEGIETEGELALAQHHGCELVQGYLMARPLRPDDVVRFFTDSVPTDSDLVAISPTR